MGMSENGCSLLSHWTLKSAKSQEWINELSWFLHAHTNSGKLKVTLIIIWWTWQKMDAAFLGHGTLKSAVSQ